jgi:peptidoglycan/LPS O-acetylase OafA/YrhL
MCNKNDKRYVPQFDFIKGIAIISVILLHAGIGLKYFSPYWIGQAVPLFICVSCALNCLSLSGGGRGGQYKELFYF